MNTSAKKEIISTMLASKRPDLANAMAAVVVTAIKKWDSQFMDERTAKLLGDKRYDYSAFHELTPQQQSEVKRRYPAKTAGTKYDFVYEHYYYPVNPNIPSQLPKGRAQRVLAIPHKLITDGEYMASLGYEVSQKWTGGSVVVTASPLIDLTAEVVKATAKGNPEEALKEIHKYLGEYKDDEAFEVMTKLYPDTDRKVFDQGYAAIKTPAYKMSKTFEVVTPESAEQGDAEERGFEYEDKEFESLFDVAKEIIDDGGGFEPSSSSPHKGMWWTTEADQDMHDGSYTSYSFHPEKISDVETKWLFNVIKKKAVR